MDNFSREIYPLWKSIEDRDLKAEEKLSMSEINAPGQLLFDVKTTHKQDKAIYDSGNKPSRIVIPPDFRKKSAASDKFSQWNG